MLISEILFVVICLQTFISVNPYEYCMRGREQKLCKEKRHILCYPEQIPFGSVYNRSFSVTSHFRKWILFWHNHFRNQLACGDVDGPGETKLPSATRLRKLVWDYELAYIARAHANRCSMEHDECRNTKRIPISGQNLFESTVTEPQPTVIETGYEAIFSWFDEHKNVDESILQAGATTEQIQTIGHFTLMSHEKVTKVGCIITFCGQEDEYLYHVTCNYDYTNMEGVPVYTFGDPASDCKHWGAKQSSTFSCLCG